MSTMDDKSVHFLDRTEQVRAICGAQAPTLGGVLLTGKTADVTCRFCRARHEFFARQRAEQFQAPPMWKKIESTIIEMPIVSSDPSVDARTLRAAQLFHIGYLDVTEEQRQSIEYSHLAEIYSAWGIGMPSTHLSSPTGRIRRGYPNVQ